jgi:uncharacterized protein YjbI with pentapeptide repeats
MTISPHIAEALDASARWFRSAGREGQPLTLSADDDLDGATLAERVMAESTLIGASLRHANLSSALLAGADLSGADLSEADLVRADFTKASLVGTRFDRVDAV